jgi:hypothetical protein
VPQHEVHGEPAVYDHETEEPRGARRRRNVADWGVGEELFDHMPSPRRRFRAADAPSSRRDMHQRPRRFEPRDEPRSAAADRGRSSGRRPLVPIDEAPTREHVLAEPELFVTTSDTEAHGTAVARREATPRGGVEGRRTIVIGGQASLARRPRPQRTVGERLGPRPDRIAGWAVALGILLIVITILSQ